ncbi:MAG: sulfur-oxidizing protein SoxX [Gammaproteobacteria bacterium]|jgi:sulfur-oxidizing protein SoxX
MIEVTRINLIKRCLLFSLFFSVASIASEAEISDLAERINQGRTIAYDRNAGNCLSCHLVLGSELPGNVGPPLIQMKLRYPERSALISQISDAAIKNPNTVMPPYGRHNILTDDEIELVVDFVHSI